MRGDTSGGGGSKRECGEIGGGNESVYAVLQAAIRYIVERYLINSSYLIVVSARIMNVRT